MLVLTRKKGERIKIGDEITIVITKVNGNRVSIGIEAPPDVSIQRAERCVAKAIESPQPEPEIPVNRIKHLVENIGSKHKGFVNS